MFEDWCEIRDFPGYAVSDLGKVMNLSTRRILGESFNNRGMAKVKLSIEGKQYTRSVASLVADAFLPQPNPRFNSVINLDGDRANCTLQNLARRPRWFAIKYHRQFEFPDFHENTTPLTLIDTGEEFIGAKTPAVRYGLHYLGLIVAATNHTPVFPTQQRFKITGW